MEKQLHTLALTVDTCAQVYAMCGELLPEAKASALITFKLHMENNFVKLECTKCGRTLYREPRKCTYPNCPHMLKNARVFDTCLAGHVNVGKMTVRPHYVGVERCTGAVDMVTRCVRTDNVSDSVIAEMFKLSQE